MPERHKGEKLSAFIGRFVSSKREQKYPIKQRLAIGYSEARQASRKDHHAKT
jgi:hypothetical protein